MLATIVLVLCFSLSLPFSRWIFHQTRRSPFQSHSSWSMKYMGLYLADESSCTRPTGPRTGDTAIMVAWRAWLGIELNRASTRKGGSD
ncbi:hypothetical protein BC827DRAFT_83368 [Russula dissimulans]|nr:hypothetical protein BC827DRAFT_83368 [Russula dissimulans]